VKSNFELWMSCLINLLLLFWILQTINLAAICTPADYNTRPLDTIYSNFIDALPVVCILCFCSLFGLVEQFCKFEEYFYVIRILVVTLSGHWFWYVG
jgi:hypothetical protein